MQVHADRILDHLGRAGLRIGGLQVLRLDPLLDVLLAQHLDAQGLEDLEVAVRLDGVDDVRRENLVELLVRDVPAVRLAAALDVVDDVVQLRLAQDRHALHRRQDRLRVERAVLVGREARQRRRLQVRVALVLGMPLALALLDLGHQLVGVERLVEFLLVVRRQVVIVVDILPTTPTARLADDLVVKVLDIHQLLGHLLLKLFLLDDVHRLLLRRLATRLLLGFLFARHISPVYNSPTCTLSNVLCIIA